MFHVPDRFRITSGRLASDASIGNNGAFMLRGSLFKRPLWVIASDGGGWEHVSVSLSDRTPTWEEMAAVKSLFWDPEDCVIQYHPPVSAYVNHHPHCLHLWRPVGITLPQPPAWMVGPKEAA